MKTATSTHPGRVLIYALIVAGIVLIAFRFGPALALAIGLPTLLFFVICPVMMFFVMRGMPGKPRP